METMSSLTESVVRDDASVLASYQIMQADIEEIQRDMIEHLEKTNEKLINFNISLSNFEAKLKPFHKQTALLLDMMKDINQRLGEMYPDIFAAYSSVHNIVSEDDSDVHMKPDPRLDNSNAPDTDPTVTVTSPH